MTRPLIHRDSRQDVTAARGDRRDFDEAVLYVDIGERSHAHAELEVGHAVLRYCSNLIAPRQAYAASADRNRVSRALYSARAFSAVAMSTSTKRARLFGCICATRSMSALITVPIMA